MARRALPPAPTVPKPEASQSHPAAAPADEAADAAEVDMMGSAGADAGDGASIPVKERRKQC
eukprot:15432548-Alexandrium_andersonii.AAC.1